MCECGCGETNGLVRLPGPATGEWFIVEVYPGCEHCHTHWALSIYRTNEADEFWRELHGDTPVASFDEYGTWHHGILDTGALKDAYAEESDDDDLSDVRFPFEEFVNRGGLRRVFFATVAKERRRAQEGDAP